MIHSLTSPASLLDESVFLNKSLEWMIQWLTHWLHLLHYWMNQCFWTNLLNEWFNDSLTDFTCFITGWISVFEQISWMNDSMTHLLTSLASLLDESVFLFLWISWMNDSMTHSLTSPASLLDESVFLNKSLEWMIQWLTHWLHLLHYWMNQCFWTNLLEEWFNDSLIDFTCFITGWISVFEQISWMNDSMTHSLTSPASLLDESVFLNKSLRRMIEIHFKQSLVIDVIFIWSVKLLWFQITTVLVCNLRLCCGVLRCRRAHTAHSKRLRVSPPHYHR